MIPQAVKPRYEVHDRRGETTVETHIMREDGRNVEKQVEVPYGFDVFFPAGHSIRVRNEAELHRLGFDQPADLIDEDGEVVGQVQMSLKKHVQRRAGASGRRADTGGVDARQGG